MLSQHNDRGTRRGAAAAELGLLLPTLVLLSLATLDVFRLFYGYITLAECARNGALYASSNSTMEQASPYYHSSDASDPDPWLKGTKRAAEADGTNLGLGDGGVDLKYSSDNTYNGSYTSTTRPTVTTGTDGYVKVTVTWTYTTTINYLLVPHTWPISRSATMRMVP